MSNLICDIRELHIGDKLYVLVDDLIAECKVVQLCFLRGYVMLEGYIDNEFDTWEIINPVDQGGFFQIINSCDEGDWENTLIELVQ